MHMKFESSTLNGIHNDIHNNFRITYRPNRRPYKVPWDSVFPIAKPPGTLAVLIVTVSAVICYVNSLDAQFVFDDSEAIVNNYDLKPETPIWNLFYNDFWGTRLTHNASHKSYRPLTVLSFRWNYWLNDGLKPRGFHLTNVVLHAVVSALSLVVYNFLFGDNCPRAAFLSALLFAVHPIHSEAVAGVVGRADLLCALFYFVSFLAYCSAVRCLNRGHLVSGVGLLVSSMAFCSAAMFCKEQGITVIGLCSIHDIIVSSKIHPKVILVSISKRICTLFGNERTHLEKDSSEENVANGMTSDQDTSEVDGPSLRWLVARHVLLAVTGSCLLLLRWRIMDSVPPTFQSVDNPASFAESLTTRVLSYNYIYALNVWLLVCPEWLCFDWSMGCIPLVSLQPPVDPRLLAVAVMWLTLGTLLWKVFSLSSERDRRSLTMSLALMIVPFLPASNMFFRVGFVIAERVLYLPSAGFCMLVVLGFRQLATLRNARRLSQLGYLYLVCVLTVRASWRSAEWRTEAVLFRTGMSVCPLNAKVHYNIAKNAADAGNKKHAVEEYREALRLNPDYDQAMNNLANILKDEGRLTDAEKLLRSAVELRPTFAAAWMNLGIVLSGLKRHEEAEASYFTALHHRNKYPDCYYNLGNLYLDQQRYLEAYGAWRNATALKPTHTVAWSNMIIMLDSIGEMTRAESVAQEALAVLPLEPSLHFNLANTLGKAGRFAEAEKHFTEAIGFDLNNPVYFTNLGVLYHRWKKFDRAERLYKKALELNPRLQSARDNLALLYKTLSKSGQGKPPQPTR